ncbi:MAG: glycosyltransferase family 1 protein [Bacilli bacterium]
MKKIRVLQIIGSMEVGGAETMLMNIYREINKEVIQFDFFLNSDKEGFYEKEIKSLGGKIYKTKPKSKHPIKYIKDLKSLLKINQYDVAHIHASSTKNFLPLKILNSCGVKKTIYHSHSSKGINAVIQKFFQNSVVRNSTIKIACSDLAASWMYGSKAKEAHIVFNPIDVNKFKYSQKDREDIRNLLNINGKKVFVHVGRFNKQKNHKFLIEIFYEINKIDNNTILLLIGEGLEENKIREQVKDLKLLGKVMFLGIKEDVFRYLSASDLFIMPSFIEGLPVTIVETQANGLPSLLSNTITKDIQQTNLVTYLPLSETAINWATQALKLVKHNELNDRTLYTNKIEKIFDAKVIVKQLEKIYLSDD